MFGPYKMELCHLCLPRPPWDISVSLCVCVYVGILFLEPTVRYEHGYLLNYRPNLPDTNLFSSRYATKVDLTVIR